MQIRLNVQIVREPPRPERRRRLRTLTLLALAALVLFVPLGFASDVFTDVPDSHPFHDQINRAYFAGMIGACGTNLFCPGNTVTKGMAANQYDKAFGLDGTPRPFTPTWRKVNIVTGGSTAPLSVDSSQQVDNLNADQLNGLHANQLGRFAQASWSFIVNPAGGATFGTTHITTTQPQEYLLADAEFYTGINAGQNASLFPCRRPFLLRVDGTTPFQNRSLAAASAPPAGDYLFQTQAIHAGFLVGPGDHTVDVQVIAELGSCNFFVGYGELAVQSIPFGATGGSPTTSMRAPTGGLTPSAPK